MDHNEICCFYVCAIIYTEQNYKRPMWHFETFISLGVAKYIKSYEIHFVVQYATDYCPLEHDNYKTISALLGSPISCYINNLHEAFIFLLSVLAGVGRHLKVRYNIHKLSSKKLTWCHVDTSIGHPSTEIIPSKVLFFCLYLTDKMW